MMPAGAAQGQTSDWPRCATSELLHLTASGTSRPAHRYPENLFSKFNRKLTKKFKIKQSLLLMSSQLAEPLWTDPCPERVKMMRVN